MLGFIALVLGVISLLCFPYAFTKSKGYSEKAKQEHERKTDLAYWAFMILFPIAYSLMELAGKY